VAKIDAAKLGEYIREQRNAAQISLRQLAKAADVSNPYLSQVERGLRRPSAEILSRIAAGLRISAETLYVRAGILEERRGDQAVITALGADQTLSERQRRALLEIYAAFQAENATGGPAADTPREEPIND
jgi:transcriptional regulator with XRE-family HTH domain